MSINLHVRNGKVVSFPANDTSYVNSPLVDFALAGLQRCWMPALGRWSHIYHLDRRSQPNESLPQSDVFYSLNVLLGMSRLAKVPDGIRVSEIFERNVSCLPVLPVATYTFGMALWVAAEFQLEIPPEVEAHIEPFVVDERRWRTYRAQDLGMLLIGVLAQIKRGRRGWNSVAKRMYRHLAQRYHCSSMLFSDAPSGHRRRFATFATQTYLTLACYYYGELTGDLAALAMANACARKLIALQGPNGEWPWFLDVRRGCVLDYYEVYSVHQYGMAPAFLEYAERHGMKEARTALIRGFNWVLGDNQLDMPMILPELSLSIRSQVRRGELNSKARRVLRALRSAYLPASTRATIIEPAAVTLRRECRSYELGWILWSFGQRSDLPELSHNAMFSAPRHVKVTALPAPAFATGGACD